jgi:hypothetical protein
MLHRAVRAVITAVRVHAIRQDLNALSDHVRRQRHHPAGASRSHHRNRTRNPSMS